MSAAARAPRALVPVAALFAGAVAFSLAGMVALRLAPSVAVSVGPLLPRLMSWPTWVYVVTLPLAAFLAFLPSLGPARSLAFAGFGSVVGAAAELVGTATGLPFGDYAYTDFLGPKILGRVPWAIPPSWYAAAILSFALATALHLRGWRRVALAAFYMVLWDVALEPAMSEGFPIWVWQEPGVFYAMPLINWFGWSVTALVITAGFERLLGGRVVEAGPWTARLWLINGLFAVGICLQAGLVLATLMGLAAVALPLVVLRSRGPAPARPAGAS